MNVVASVAVSYAAASVILSSTFRLSSVREPIAAAHCGNIASSCHCRVIADPCKSGGPACDNADMSGAGCEGCGGEERSFSNDTAYNLSREQSGYLPAYACSAAAF